MNIEENIKRILNVFFHVPHIDSYAEKNEWKQSVEMCTSFIVYPYDGGYNVGVWRRRGNEDYDSKLKKREDEQKFL